MNYLDKVNEKTLEYFKILEPNFPDWLLDYINTKEMLKQQYISITCGTIYTDLFDSSYFFFKFRPFNCGSAYHMAFYP